MNRFPSNTHTHATLYQVHRANLEIQRRAAEKRDQERRVAELIEPADPCGPVTRGWSFHLLATLTRW